MTQRNWRCEDGDHKRCSAMSCRCFCHLFDHNVFRVGTGIKRLLRVSVGAAYYYVRNSFPLWRDAAHLEAISKIRREHESRIRELNAQHHREIDTERAQLENLLPKLIKITDGYQRDRFSGRFTITTALSEDFVYQVLSGYARDNRAMDYIGERQQVSWMNPDGLNFPPR